MTPLTYPNLPTGDFGFGSAYERLALYTKIECWLREWNGKDFTSIEGFYDSFAGLPGLHLLPLAKAGGKVTVACQSDDTARAVETVYDHAGLRSQLQTMQAHRPEELSGRKFDIVFLFNPFPFVDEWEHFLDAAAGLAGRYLIVSVCSRSSYGIVFRRLMKRIKPSSGVGLDLFEHPSSDPRIFRHYLSKYGDILEEDFFDAPWWPDFYGGPGDTVLTWMLKQFGWQPKPSTSPSATNSKPNHSYGPSSFPYPNENSPALAELRRKISRHLSFDKLPTGLLKALFAHHRIFVVRRPSPA